MASSVGQIGLDLVVNQKQFNKQMSGIKGIAVKAGAALAAAFALKKIADFGKECLQLGSDLQEVQNVVNVVFPSMRAQVDAFAQSAITTIGISEKMAKQFTGIYGSMAKAFGFSESAAYEMSTTLTSLAGDVASFYNLEPDAAYTKLKAVFSGETEVLKDLGIVMTQSALDSYAMAKGYGKLVKDMSEAEKVSLRYMFIQDKLAAAQGDFARTSDSWANQTKVLKLQFDSLKASIGQGLINVLTPVIKMINTLVGKLQGAANAFRDFTAMITGNKNTGSTISSAATGAGELTANMTDAGSAAKKTAKEIKGLMGFDELNLISSSDSSGADAGAGTDFNTDFGDQIAAQEQKSNAALDAVKNKIRALVDSFKNGFKDGIGDDFFNSLGRIKEHAAGIKDSLVNIATDPEVQNSFSGMVDKWVYSMGQNTGALASVGATIGENITGGLDGYFAENKDFIKERLSSIFSNMGNIFADLGDLSVVGAEIFEVFRSDDAKQITTDLTTIFSNAFLGATNLATLFGEDVVNLIVTPITENADGIKLALENTLAPISTVIGTVKDGVNATFDKIFEVYDTKVRPAFEGITEGLSELFGVILDTYNEYIAPVLDVFAEKFDALFKEHLQPLIDEVIILFGNLAELFEVLWTNVLQPFFTWFMETIVPAIMPVIEKIGDVIFTVVGAIIDIFKGLFKILNGIIEFVVGVFQGDWGKAWDGIVKAFTGVWDAIKAVFSTIWEAIKGIIEIAIEAIKSVVKIAFEWIKETVTNIFTAIRDFFEGAWNKIKEFFTNAVDNIKDKVVNGFQNIKNKISTTIGNIKDTIINGFNKAVDFIKELPKKALTWGKDIILGIVDGIKGAIGKITEAASDIAGKIKEFLHFSVPDRGPLTDYETYMPDMIDGLTRTLKGAAPTLYKQVETIAGNISKGLTPQLNIGGADFVRSHTPALAFAGTGTQSANYGTTGQQTMTGTADHGVTLSELMSLLPQIAQMLTINNELSVNLDARQVYKSVKEMHNQDAQRRGREKW